MTDETRSVYYGNTTQRDAHDQTSDASGDLFWNYDGGTLYVWTGSIWRALPNYQQSITVAKSGADFTTIQGAIDSISDAAAGKRYAVLVYPGDYAEAVTMTDYVDIIGAGRTNSRITGTSGTVLTFPATKGTVIDMGIYVDYGTLGAASQAITSAGADSVMIRCDIGVTKSSGDFVMNALYISAGAFRMSDCYFTYSITGATVATQLIQSAVVQTGVLTTVILNNNEMTITSDDTNDDLVGFETTANVTGTALLANNVIDVDCGAAGSSATGLWLYGTGSGMIANQNRITVNCNASAYGLWIDSTAGGATVDTRHNEIIATAVGAAQSAFVAAGDTWNSTFDKITAASGYAGAGTITFVSSQIDGEFSTTGSVGVGATSPSAKLHVDQETSDAAIPVLYLDQADVSEEMIEFACTIGVGNAIEAVGTKALTTTHFIKVTLPGGLTRYFPVGTVQANTTRIDSGDSPYNVASTDVVLFCDTDGGAITANLPAGVEGAHHKLINCGSSGNDVTVEGDGAETVYGAANQTLADGEVIDIHYNSVEGWY